MLKREHPSIAIRSNKNSNYYYHCLSYSVEEHTYDKESCENVISNTNICHICTNKKCIYHNNIKMFKYYSNVCSCVSCGEHLDFGYIIIISRLKEHNLLTKNIDLLCCKCYYTKKLLVEIYENDDIP